LIKADTKADTKRYDSDAFLDSVALEIIVNSSREGWSGCPLTPVTRVRIPLGLPVKKKSHYMRLFFILRMYFPALQKSNTSVSAKQRGQE
jgi:hypothetical protein